LPNTLAWKPGKRPLPEKGAPKKGRRGESDIVSLKEIALALPARAWRTVKWREATCDVLSSRFARVRVHVAHRHLMVDRHAEEWLLIEWPTGEAEPTKYWLSTVERNIAFDRLVDLAKLRWRIERDYQELKQEVGLGHYEGRGWRGFHHHITLSIAAYGFLVSERETIPPSAPHRALLRPPPALPQGWRARGSPPPA
jgi:SRSO17 transposase